MIIKYPLIQETQLGYSLRETTSNLTPAGSEGIFQTHVRTHIAWRIMDLGKRLMPVEKKKGSSLLTSIFNFCFCLAPEGLIYCYILLSWEQIHFRGNRGRSVGYFALGCEDCFLVMVLQFAVVFWEHRWSAWSRAFTPPVTQT